MSDTPREEFWDRLEDTRTAMLGLKDDPHLVPMSPQVDDDDPTGIWFITARGTDLVTAAESGPKEARMIVSDDKQGLYADLTGTLSLDTDRARLEEFWSPIASAWFEDGLDDPDLRLLCFRPAKGEAWLTETSGFKFLYEIAKANLTGEKPDAGRQVSLTF